MPPTARWPLSRPVLLLRPPRRAAGSRGGAQDAQQVVDGAQLHSLHRRRRAFLVRDLGAEAGLVDDDAAEFVLHDNGVAGVRPFRLKQRSSRLLLSARLRQEFLRNILGRALPNDLLLLVQRRDQQYGVARDGREREFDPDRAAGIERDRAYHGARRRRREAGLLGGFPNPGV